MYRRISAVVAETLDDGQFPFVLSGDHSNAGGTIAGIKQAFPLARLGVVWIDAHADMHSPYTSPSGNMHGMPLATALGEDNLECKINDPSPVTRDSWIKLKGHQQRVRPEDIAFIGLRSTEQPEDYLIEKYGMAVYRVAKVRELGIARVVAQVLEQLKDCDMVYVSFDVDSMDPSISVGTGTPVPGGFDESEAKQLLELFADAPPVRCMEFTEINPLLDKGGNAMGTTAFRLLQNTVYRLQERLSRRTNL
jgi:arginase